MRLTILTTILILAFELCAQNQNGLGMAAFNLKTGEQVSQGFIHQEFIPASVLKVVTCAMAWEKLGSDFEFVSEIFVSGKVDVHGIVHGDLVISADGDPSWDSRHLGAGKHVAQQIYDILCEVGIHAIRGGLTIRTRTPASDHISRYWLWEDLGNYYASGAWPVNWQDNSIQIDFKREKEHWIVASSDPIDITSKWSNEISMGPAGSGDQAYVFGSPYQESRFIRGTLPADRNTMTIKASMPNPIEAFGDHLTEFLIEKGIQIGPRIATSHGDVKEMLPRVNKIGELRSPDLSWMIRKALRHSDNLYVEALAKRCFPSSNNYDDFLDSVNHYSQTRWSGIDIVLKDACGLSPTNRASTNALLSIWKDIVKNQKDFLDLMPRYDQVSLGRELDQRGVIKSGSMGDVLCYMGCDAKAWIYVVMYNGAESPSKIRKKMGDFINSISK